MLVAAAGLLAVEDVLAAGVVVLLFVVVVGVVVVTAGVVVVLDVLLDDIYHHTPPPIIISSKTTTIAIITPTFIIMSEQEKKIDTQIINEKMNWSNTLIYDIVWHIFGFLSIEDKQHAQLTSKLFAEVSVYHRKHDTTTDPKKLMYSKILKKMITAAPGITAVMHLFNKKHSCTLLTQDKKQRLRLEMHRSSGIINSVDITQTCVEKIDARPGLYVIADPSEVIKTDNTEICRIVHPRNNNVMYTRYIPWTNTDGSLSLSTYFYINDTHTLDLWYEANGSKIIISNSNKLIVIDTRFRKKINGDVTRTVKTHVK